MNGKHPRAILTPLIGVLALLTTSSCASSPSADAADSTATGSHPLGETTTEASQASEGYGEIEKTFTGSGPEVDVLGDSIMVRTKDDLRRELDGFSLKVAAARGEGLAGGAISEASGWGGMTAVAASYAADSPDVLVIELGTNDAWLAPLTADDAESALEEIIGEFPDACTVVVAITESSTAEGYDRDQARQINRALAAVADQLVQWGTASTDGDGLLQSDGIHPTAEGVDLLASSIGDAVRACGA